MLQDVLVKEDATSNSSPLMNGQFYYYRCCS